MKNKMKQKKFIIPQVFIIFHILSNKTEGE